MMLKVIANLITQSAESNELMRVKKAFLLDIINMCRDGKDNRRCGNAIFLSFPLAFLQTLEVVADLNIRCIPTVQLCSTWKPPFQDNLANVGLAGMAYFDFIRFPEIGSRSQFDDVTLLIFFH